MIVAPGSIVQLCSCPLLEDQENQLTWRTSLDQDNYFVNLPSKGYSGCTYQRDIGAIRIPDLIDNIRQFNYLLFRNPGGKMFYAFITKMEYANESMTRVYFKIDVYQTYWQELKIDSSFVEREHVNSDGYMEHTIPEGLEYGDYIIKQYLNFDWGDPANSWYCMQVSDLPSAAEQSYHPDLIYNGMPSGCYYLLFPHNNIAGLQKWITAYDKDQKASAILSIFPLPYRLLHPDGSSTTYYQQIYTDIDNNTFIATPSYSPIKITSYSVPSPFDDKNIDGYTPKNNKLYTFPYCYFYINNFAGTTVEFKYEQFNKQITMDIYGCLTSGGEFRCVPMGLNNVGYGAYGYGVNLASTPQGSWNQDTYLNWLALNRDAITIQATSEVAQSVVGGINSASQILTGNLLGAATGIASNAISAATAIAQAENQFRVAKRMPDQAKGDTANQTLAWGRGHTDGGIYIMTIKKEYAKIIDQYFTMFGYKVNELKVPNITGRKNWNYVKTINANVEGNIPQEAKEEFKAMLDHGMTFWHRPSTMFDYTQDNSIV